MIERTVGSTVTTGFPIYDAHGNNVATPSRNGSGGYSVADRRSYDAWGVVRAQQSAGEPKLRYRIHYRAIEYLRSVRPLQNTADISLDDGHHPQEQHSTKQRPDDGGALAWPARRLPRS